MLRPDPACLISSLLLLAASSVAAQNVAPGQPAAPAPNPRPPEAAASAPDRASRSPAGACPTPSNGANRRPPRSSSAARRSTSSATRTLGEVLRRLPGVSTPGRPGRGGAPRLRGLGGGYTQLLIDGERVPPGFSLESLTPEQIERIEILRAPTAETGARAIAGTINIITREGFRQRLNDLRLGAGYENGRVRPPA